MAKRPQPWRLEMLTWVSGNSPVGRGAGFLADEQLYGGINVDFDLVFGHTHRPP